MIKTPRVISSHILNTLPMSPLVSRKIDNYCTSTNVEPHREATRDPLGGNMAKTTRLETRFRQEPRARPPHSTRGISPYIQALFNLGCKSPCLSIFHSNDALNGARLKDGYSSRGVFSANKLKEAGPDMTVFNSSYI